MALIALASTARAETKAPPSGDADTPISSVTVTHARAPQDLALGAPASDLKTPLSISTVPTDLVLEQGGTTLLDALHNVPGAQPDLSFTGSHSQVAVLRGSIADSGTQSSRIVRDGARLSNYAFTPAFVDQVNVLRGPGAAASTRSEPGGTIEVATKTAELRDFGTAYARVGAHNAREAWVDVNRVLSADHGVAGRVVLVHSTEDEWRHAKDRLDGIKLGLSKTDGDRYRVSFDFEGTNQIYNPDFGLPALNGKVVAVPRDRQLGEPFKDSTTNNRVYSLHGDYRLTPTTQVRLDYTRMDSKTTSVRNSVFSIAAGQPVGTYNRATAYEPGGKRIIDSVAVSAVSTFATGILTHNLYVGGEYYAEDLNLPSLAVPSSSNPRINVYNPAYGLVVAPTGTLARTLTIQDTKSWLLSAQDRIEIGRLNLIAGLQWVDMDSAYGTVGVVKPVTETRLSPKLGVTYALSSTQSLYGSYSTGSAFQPVLTTSGQSAPMRHSKQYEVGWKLDMGDGRLRADAALFRLDHDNMIAGDPAFFGRFLIGGQARSQGLEASINGQITDRLSVNLAYANTDAKYREASLYPGKHIPNVARDSGSLWGQMRWDAHWRTGLGLLAQGDRYADGANTTRLPGYVRVDLVQAYRIKVDGRPLELQLNIENLLDKDYFAGSHVHVARYILPGEGRNASVSLSYRF
jgi:iron complex outermembrane receptor protein